MNCLIIDDLHESWEKLFTGIGLNCDYRPDIQREEIKKVVDAYDGIIVRSKTKLDEDLLQNATQLKFVGRAGAGLDQIDQDYLKRRGVTLFGAAKGNADAVGEHTLGMLLALQNKLLTSHHEVTNFEWNREKNRGIEIQGKTVGIIGYGNMGSAFARRLSGFACNVIAYDKYKKGFTDDYVTEVSIEKLWNETEILSLHIPLTTETNDLVNTTYIEKFDQDIVLLNAARGPIVNIESLLRALNSGKVVAAGLDVLPNEKFDSLTEEERKNYQKLFKFPNVLITPHVAGWSYESKRKINEVLTTKIETFMNSRMG